MFFLTTLYGDHPYAYGNDIGLIVAALQNMTPADFEQFYQRTVDPANMVMAISGDFDLQAMEEMIIAEFGDWESKGGALKESKVMIDEANYNRIILVHKEDATHAKMMLGYNFYSSGEDEVLPNGQSDFWQRRFFQSLNDNLRSRMGYVYDRFRRELVPHRVFTTSRRMAR